MDGSIIRTQEYKGCGIHAASYKVGTDWVPEACFWVRTKNGWTRMWINSFARFFEIPELGAHAPAAAQGTHTGLSGFRALQDVWQLA